MHEELATTFENFEMSHEEAQEYITHLFEGYKARKKEYNQFDFIPHNIIGLYYYYINKKHFNIIFQNYKDKYIYNESRVETNCTHEEQIGIGKVYDYIQNYNSDFKNFNIFLESMKIHQLLYSECEGKEFGGKLRDNDVVLYDTNIEVVPAYQAKKIFNSYIVKSKEIIASLEECNIFDYIDNCIKISTELMKLQPFYDGNKRTFRALLNLMLKNKNLAPIYIEVEQRDLYKEFLLQAMKGDYEKLTRFYYYKICDAIVELDIKYTNSNNQKIK